MTTASGGGGAAGALKALLILNGLFITVPGLYADEGEQRMGPSGGGNTLELNAIVCNRRLESSSHSYWPTEFRLNSK